MGNMWKDGSQAVIRDLWGVAASRWRGPGRPLSFQPLFTCLAALGRSLCSRVWLRWGSAEACALGCAPGVSLWSTHSAAEARLLSCCTAWALRCSRAQGILVPQPGFKPPTPCIARQSLNHRTTREVPIGGLFTFYNA